MLADYGQRCRRRVLKYRQVLGGYFHELPIIMKMSIRASTVAISVVLLCVAVVLMVGSTCIPSRIHTAVLENRIEYLRALHDVRQIDATWTSCMPSRFKKVTPLHLSCYEGSPSAADALISKGARLELRDGFGQTPLMIAARITNGTEIVDLLIDAGANPNEVDQRGYTAVMIAAESSAYAAVQ